MKKNAFLKSQSASSSQCDLSLDPRARLLPTQIMRAMAVLKDGSLLTTEEGNACFSNDDGRTWTKRPIFKDPRRSARFENALIRCKSGTIVLVYMDQSTLRWKWDDEKNEPAPGARMEVWSVRSSNEGKTWSEPVRLFDGYCGAIIGGIQTKNGRIVVPVQRLLYDPGRHAQVTYHSDDEGRTWEHSNIIDIGGRGHHDGGFEGILAELSNGRLWMLIRTNLEKFWQAYSDDNGAYWRTIMPTNIDASSAPAYILRLSSGKLMMAWNRLYPAGLTTRQKKLWERAGGDSRCQPVASWHRRELSIAFSKDDGKRWTKPVVLLRGKKLGYSYPFILERRRGEIWVITRFNQKVAVSLREKDFC